MRTGRERTRAYLAFRAVLAEVDGAGQPPLAHFRLEMRRLCLGRRPRVPDAVGLGGWLGRGGARDVAAERVAAMLVHARGGGPAAAVVAVVTRHGVARGPHGARGTRWAAGAARVCVPHPRKVAPNCSRPRRDRDQSCLSRPARSALRHGSPGRQRLCSLDARARRMAVRACVRLCVRACMPSRRLRGRCSRALRGGTGATGNTPAVRTAACCGTQWRWRQGTWRSATATPPPAPRANERRPSSPDPAGHTFTRRRRRMPGFPTHYFLKRVCLHGPPRAGRRAPILSSKFKVGGDARVASVYALTRVQWAASKSVRSAGGVSSLWQLASSMVQPGSAFPVHSMLFGEI